MHGLTVHDKSFVFSTYTLLLYWPAANVRMHNQTPASGSIPEKFYCSGLRFTNFLETHSATSFFKSHDKFSVVHPQRIDTQSRMVQDFLMKPSLIGFEECLGLLS